ncbi:MAG: hypothetical protein JWM80_4402, partial [Cyanobacteria bacterium RYN_339]|nr:hypothetical protein [Cyanobacteria bacterium RYN_339]
MRSVKCGLALACCLALLSGCNLAPAKTAGVTEGVVDADRNGKLHVTVGGRSFSLVTADGKAVADLQLQIAGKPYASSGGKLFLPESALADLKRTGGFVALVPGYVPRRIGLDGTADIALLPVTPLGPVQAVSRGGTVRASLQGLAATFGQGTLTADGTQVAVATYQPATGTRALGLQLTVDGQLNPGTLTVAYDLGLMLQGWDGKPPEPWGADPNAWPADARQRALFAAQVTTAFAALTPAQQQQMAQTYGITLANGVLTFNVTLGDNAQTDGLARVEVDGLSQLGVTLEVTVLSSLGGTLAPLHGDSPAQTLTPGREPAPVVIIAPPVLGTTTPTGTVPVPTIISEHGVGLLADAGAGVVANNGGNLIGKVKGPTGLLADAGAGVVAKRRLLTYTETAWAGVQVALERSDGSSYGAGATTDATGAYAITGLPDTAPFAFVHANTGLPSLFA